MRVLVSACLVGRNCKYSGGNNYSQKLMDFLADKEVVEICPEVLAGMPIPRPRVEIFGGKLINEFGKDVDKQYREGVEKALQQIKGQDIDLVVLQSRSPTCGVHQVYDGTFSGKLLDGQGVLAEALIKAGYKVIDIEDL